MLTPRPRLSDLACEIAKKRKTEELRRELADRLEQAFAEDEAFRARTQESF